MADSFEHRERIDFGSWLFRIIAWDGIMPILVLLVPCLGFWWNNLEQAIRVFAIIVPIVALIVRYIIGIRHIEKNRVGRMLRSAQIIVFKVALFYLCLIDCFAVAIHDKLLDPPANLLVIAFFYSLYLPVMIFVMYPGKTVRITEPEVMDIIE